MMQVTTNSCCQAGKFCSIAKACANSVKLVPDLPNAAEECVAMPATMATRRQARTKSDRQARIVAELRATPSLRVNELAGLLERLDRDRAPRPCRARRARPDQPHLWRRRAADVLRAGAGRAREADGRRARAYRRARPCSWSSQRHPDDRRRRDHHASSREGWRPSATTSPSSPTPSRSPWRCRPIRSTRC